jgi:hypothetical protein
VPVGATYAVTIATQPSLPAQTCAVTNGNGIMPAGNVTNVAVMCPRPLPRFAYFTSDVAGELLKVDFDPTTGAVVAVDSPIALPSLAVTLSVRPDNKFLYTANLTAASFSGFAIDAATGVLTPLAGSPFGPVSSPRDLRFTPMGVSRSCPLLFDRCDRRPVESHAGRPYNAGGGVFGVTVDPGARFVDAVSYGTRTISVLSIDPDTSELTHVSGSPFAAGGIPVEVVADPGRRFRVRRAPVAERDGCF